MNTKKASFYERRVAPLFVRTGCSLGVFSRLRERIIPEASGVVVEVGFGSGLNLPYYDGSKVEKVIGVDPDEAMLGLAGRGYSDISFELQIVRAGAEDMPFQSASVDTVVTTYALCTIVEPLDALAEMRRILKPDGQLLFVEHGHAGCSWRGRLQGRLNKMWSRMAGGCNLNRNPSQLIKQAGFIIRDLYQERFPAYLPQLGIHISGVAHLSFEEAIDQTEHFSVGAA